MSSTMITNLSKHSPGQTGFRTPKQLALIMAILFHKASVYKAIFLSSYEQQFYFSFHRIDTYGDICYFLRHYAPRAVLMQSTHILQMLNVVKNH